MALIIEDGSVVPNANSYITLVDAQTRAVDMGLDFTAGTEAQLIQAMKEINKYSFEFLSTRFSADQAVLIDFPRVTFTDNNGFQIAEGTIPQNLIDAQVQGAVDILNGYVVYETSDGKNVASEEVVGAVKQSFFNNGVKNSAEGSNRSPAVLNYLKPYIQETSSLISTSAAEMLVAY